MWGMAMLRFRNGVSLAMARWASMNFVGFSWLWKSATRGPTYQWHVHRQQCKGKPALIGRQ